MNEVDLSTIKFPHDRQKLRTKIINIFLKERPGLGKKELASRYKYTTKKLTDGRIVFLSRPAQLNNGLDFTVNVSNTNFNRISKKRVSKRPTHAHILEDLKIKKDSDQALYIELIKQIKVVYICQDYKLLSKSFASGHPVELILECIKWLFIEQDVTYWNYSGRAMLYNAILKI